MRTLAGDVSAPIVRGLTQENTSPKAVQSYHDLKVVSEAIRSNLAWIDEQGQGGISYILSELAGAGQITTETYDKLVALQKRAIEHGLDEVDTAKTLAMVYGNLKTAVAEHSKAAEKEAKDKLAALAAEVKAADDAAKNEVKARADKVKQAERYLQLLAQKTELEGKSIKGLTDLERLKLQVINDQLAALQGVSVLAQKSAKQALAAWVAEWATAIDRVKGMTGDDWKRVLEAVKPPKASDPKPSTTKAPTPADNVISAADWATAQLEAEKDTLTAVEAARREHLIRVMELEAQYRGVNLDAALRAEQMKYKKLTEIAESEDRERAERTLRAEVNTFYNRKMVAEQHAQTMTQLAGKVTAAEKVEMDYRLELLALNHQAALGEINNYEDARARLEQEYAARRHQARLEEERLKRESLQRQLQDVEYALNQAASLSERMGSKSAQILGVISGITGGVTAAVDKYANSEATASEKIVGSLGAVAGAALEQAAAREKSEKKQAAILGARYAIEAIVAGVEGDVAKAIGYGVASAAYFALAGTSSSGSSSKPATVYRAPSSATATQRSEQGGATYHFHVSGIMAGSSREFAQETARLMNANRGLVYLDESLISSAGADL